MVAMYRMGAVEMANSQLEMAREYLTDEEYRDLLAELKKANVAPSLEQFRNGKYPL